MLFKAHLDKQVDIQVKAWTDAGIDIVEHIDDSYKKWVQIGKSFQGTNRVINGINVDDRTRAIARDYVYNEHIAQANAHALLGLDPYQFTSEKIIKKANGDFSNVLQV